jgi:hypothetical protein
MMIKFYEEKKAWNCLKKTFLLGCVQKYLSFLGNFAGFDARE